MQRFLTTVLAVMLLAAPLAMGAEKGSQLIFQANDGHKNFISITNTADKMAVTVLTQFYNDEMELQLWYLRLIPGGGNAMFDPFNHDIPGTDPPQNTGAHLGGKEQMGRFVIVVTAVGANSADRYTGTPTLTVDGDTIPADPAQTANILFPTFLAEDLHGVDNIDAMGKVTVDNESVVRYATASVGDGDSATDGDQSTRNVGDLSIGNATPVAFNYLTGHFTEAIQGADASGGDQTASWGGSPITRAAVNNTANEMGGTDGISTYQTLNGMDSASATGGGRLAEQDAGGSEMPIQHTVVGYTNEGGNLLDTDPDTEGVQGPGNGGGKIDNTPSGSTRDQRGLDGGYLVLPALHGGGEMAHQIALLLSAADDFGKPGEYKLIPALTKYKVTLMDGDGDALADPAAADSPVFGGTEKAETPPGVSIIVSGISVMVDAGKCSGTAIDGPWMLRNLTALVPDASSGSKDFDGLDAMLDDSNASPGWIKFARTALDCEKDYGDGDAATGSTIEDADGVPTSDKRMYKTGTLVIEEAAADRSFVTTGSVLLKFLTPVSTFAASWEMTPMESPAN